jgi:hypothetical protein
VTIGTRRRKIASNCGAAQRRAGADDRHVRRAPADLRVEVATDGHAQPSTEIEDLTRIAAHLRAVDVHGSDDAQAGSRRYLTGHRRADRTKTDVQDANAHQWIIKGWCVDASRRSLSVQRH